MNFSLLLFFSLLPAPVASFAPPEPLTPLQVAQSVDRRYARLKSLRADFEENYRGAGIQRNESGTLTLKTPGRMRWDYRQPRVKLFVTDGKTAYFYVPGERQVRKAAIKKLDDVRSPLRFLLGKAKLTEEFTGLELIHGPVSQPENVVLSGVPRRLADRVLRVAFEVTPSGHIVRLQMNEIDGSETEFRFVNIVEDLKVADDFFRFKVPVGVELIDAKDMVE